MRRLTPTHIALIVGALILIGLAVLFLGRGGGEEDKLSDNQLASAAPSPDQRCASARTYDVIKREIFRLAAEMRGSDQAAFDRLAAYAALRVDHPVLKSRDAEIGTIRCAGKLSLDLPPGVAVVGGRHTLSADVDYVLQSAADNSGDVVMLEGADAIIVPLATLARTAAAQTPPVQNEMAPETPPAPSAPDQLPDVGTPPTQPPAPPAPTAPQATASPSFNCAYARSRGEIAVCGDRGLAALDRQMAAQYYRAVGSANAGQRETLRTTRAAFVRYRDSCPNNACVAETYKGRIREIRDIIAGTWRPQR
jgi:uncharacterized protein YecT (DUF1311 family)